MRASAKVGLVAGGYVAAILIAIAVAAANAYLTNDPDGSASGGMAAFGDSLLFLAVFGVAAIPATCAALVILKPFQLFWTMFCIVVVAISATALAALVGYFAGRSAETGSLAHTWSALAVLRILIAPLLAGALTLAALLAPSRTSRIVFVGGAAIEVGVFACVALMWFLSFQPH